MTGLRVGRRLFGVGAVVALSLSLALAPPARAHEEAEPAEPAALPQAVLEAPQAVKAAYTAYRRAVELRDGGGAFKLLAPAAVARFDELRRLALLARKPEVRKLPLAVQIMVVQLRREWWSEILEIATAEEIFTWLLKTGKLPAERLVPLYDLQPVSMTEHSAVGYLYNMGSKADRRRGDLGWNRITFARGPDGWLVDPVTFEALSSGALAKIAVADGDSEDVFVLNAAGIAETDPVRLTLWQPLGIPNP